MKPCLWRGQFIPKLLGVWPFLPSFLFFPHDIFFCTSKVWSWKVRIYSLATSIARKFHFGQYFNLVKDAVTLYSTICPLLTSFTVLLLKPEIACLLEILVSDIKSPKSFSFFCWNNRRNGKQTRTTTHVTFSQFACDLLNFSASKKERCSKAYSKWRYYVLEKEWICHFDGLWGKEQINRLLIVRRQLSVKNVQEMISVGLCWFNDIFKLQ